MISSSLKRHMAAFVLAFVLPLLGVFIWWGGFENVEIRAATTGPYTYAYMEQQGDYAKLTDLVAEVEKELRGQNIKPGLPITVLLDSPDLVDVGKRRGRTGFLLPAGSQVHLPLMQETLPARQVITARVQAGSLIAPGKAYAALDAYQQARGQGIVMPTVEIYTPAATPTQMGVLVVQMPLKASLP